MKAPFSLSWPVAEKIILVITLLSTATFWTYPEAALAATLPAQGQNSALVFEVKQTDLLFKPNSPQLAYEEVIKNDPLYSAVKNYLTERSSPLADYSGQIIALPQWQRALAISFVESNFCQTAADNNCGSLGVKPGHAAWRTYNTAFDGIKDLSAVLEKPLYKERLTTCKSMLRVYVVPGSANWRYGCEKVSSELLALTAQAEQARNTLAQQTAFPVSAAVVQLALK